MRFGTYFRRLLWSLGGVAGLLVFLNVLLAIPWRHPPAAKPCPAADGCAPTTVVKTTVRPGNERCHLDNITLVSAFFDLGDHKKGSGRRKMTEYYDYSKALAYINNPLVFYTDSDAFGKYVTELRSRLHPEMTYVIKVSRDTVWPFNNLKGSIAQLYSKRGYPKHHPNTVLPEYTCTQHAKYSFLLDVIQTRHNIPTTEVYAWMDVGYFRDIRNDKKDYCVGLPKNFSPSKVFFNQITKPNFRQPPKEIYYRNQVWVGGGMFFAARETMLEFVKAYQRSVEHWLLKRDLSSTDQQNLYASMTEEGRKEVKLGVDIQVEPGTHDWFFLGFSCLYPVPDLRNTSASTTVHSLT